jgi:N-[(2S)-2-amino-2-carboxyethyl]-L-glutamate dehydrogenase
VRLICVVDAKTAKQSIETLILACQNVVDNADHVCREGTSLFLAEELTGGRAFIGASIGELLRGGVDFIRDPGRTVIFSPFGPEALDVALAQFVLATAISNGLGLKIDDFMACSDRMSAQK